MIECRQQSTAAPQGVGKVPIYRGVFVARGDPRHVTLVGDGRTGGIAERTGRDQDRFTEEAGRGLDLEILDLLLVEQTLHAARLRTVQVSRLLYAHLENLLMRRLPTGEQRVAILGRQVLDIRRKSMSQRATDADV